MNKNKLSFILRFVISFGLLAVLIWLMRKDAENILNTLKNCNKMFFLLGLLINIPLSVALAYRLKLLLEGQKIPLSINNSIYLTFIGYFFNNFLPTAIGGDIIKAYYASKKTNNTSASYAAVFVDRLLGCIATLFIACIGLLFIGKELENSAIAWLVSGVFILSIAALFFLLSKKNTKIEVRNPCNEGVFNKLKEKLSKLYLAINIYRDTPGILIKTLFLSLILQSFAILSVYFFILCIGGGIFLTRLFLIIPLIWAVSMLPSLNGLGVREGAFVYFLKPYIGTDKAFALSILWLGIIIFNSLIGGVLHLLYPIKLKDKK